MAGEQDMTAANATYGSFIGLLRWAIPVIAVIVAFVLYLIS